MEIDISGLSRDQVLAQVTAAITLVRIGAADPASVAVIPHAPERSIMLIQGVTVEAVRTISPLFKRVIVDQNVPPDVMAAIPIPVLPREICLVGNVTPAAVSRIPVDLLSFLCVDQGVTAAAIQAIPNNHGFCQGLSLENVDPEAASAIPPHIKWIYLRPTVRPEAVARIPQIEDAGVYARKIFL